MELAHIYFLVIFLAINGLSVDACFFRSLFSSSSSPPFNPKQNELQLDKETISVVQQTLVKTLISLGKLKFHCPRDNGTYPDIIDCRKYYNCSNSQVKMGECEVGLGFDTQSKACIPAVGVSLCQKVTKLADFKCNGTGLHTFEGDCRKFVLCTEESAFSSSCNHGDIFDHTYALCLPEGEGNCTTKAEGATGNTTVGI